MFNTPRPKPTETRYLFDLSRYFKIWYSKNPEEYLGIENQLRFIRMRRLNPSAHLFFIYSSYCLLPSAIDALFEFCRKFQITPIEFEGLESLLIGREDKILYAHAKEEIQRTLDKTGGNLAAAADCTRILVPVIERYGIYSDFDVESRLSTLASHLSLRSPLLLTTEMLLSSKTDLILSSNSDFLAFSLDEHDPAHLSSDALHCIQNLQSVIIHHYEKPFLFKKLSPSLTFKDLSNYPELEEIFIDFYREFPEDPSIFNFRCYLSKHPAMPLKEKQPEEVISFLSRLSVINISGPGTYHFLFSHKLPTGFTNFPAYIPFKEHKWLPFLALYERCGIGFYEEIAKLVDNKNSIKGMTKQVKAEHCSDQSWTESGYKAKIKREESIEHAASAIQSFWKHRSFWKVNFVEKSLLKQLTKVGAAEEIIKPVQEKNYALALRRACAKLKLPVVLLLLQYKEKRALQFDINEPSPSNGNTALDWVIKAKIKSPIEGAIQKKIEDLLRSHHALTAEETKAAEVERLPSSLS